MDLGEEEYRRIYGWTVCVMDMCIKSMNIEMTADREEWKKKTRYADPRWDKGYEEDYNFPK